MSMVPGLVRGLYVPTTSTGRPLRARSFSITTTRYCGCLRAPVRDRRIINTELNPFLIASGRLEQRVIFAEFTRISKLRCLAGLASLASLAILAGVSEALVRCRDRERQPGICEVKP